VDGLSSEHEDGVPMVVEECRALLRKIEEWFADPERGPDDAVDNLIFVSFIENLPTPQEEHTAILSELGPALSDAYHRLWPSSSSLHQEDRS
jgi:hypothetical protein